VSTAEAENRVTLTPGVAQSRSAPNKVFFALPADTSALPLFDFSPYSLFLFCFADPLKERVL